MLIGSEDHFKTHLGLVTGRGRPGAFLCKWQVIAYNWKWNNDFCLQIFFKQTRGKNHFSAVFCSISAFMAKLKMSLRIAVCLFQECVCNAVVTDPLFFKVCIPNDGHVEQVRPRCLQFILLHCLHYLPVNCSVVQLPSLQRESVAASSPNRRQRSRILCVWPHAGRTAIHSLLLAVSNSQIHSLPSSSSSKHPNSPLIVRCLLQRFPQFCKARGHCRCIDESPRVTESISAKKKFILLCCKCSICLPIDSPQFVCLDSELL